LTSRKVIWEKGYTPADLANASPGSWLGQEPLLLGATPDFRTAAAALPYVAVTKNGQEGRWDSIRILDVPTGKELAKLPLKPDGIFTALAISPGGQQVAVGSLRDVEVWDVRAQTKRLFDCPGGVSQLAYSPGGGFLAVGGVGFLRLVDGRTFSTLAEYALPSGINNRRTALVFSGDDRWIAAGSDNGIIAVFDSKTLKEVARLEGHSGEIRSLSFSADRRLLLSAATDGTVRLWDLVGWRQLAQYDTGGSLAELVPGKGMFAVSGRTGGGPYGWLQLWRLPPCATEGGK
jgi:WD40 repeat protein